MVNGVKKQNFVKPVLGDDMVVASGQNPIDKKIETVAFSCFDSLSNLLFTCIDFIKTSSSRLYEWLFNIRAQNQHVEIDSSSAEHPAQVQGIFLNTNGFALKDDGLSSAPETNDHDEITVLSLETKAAIVIQKYVRGYLARRSHLSTHFYAKYRTQCEKARTDLSMPQASAGQTTVYLPQEMPEVVLKQSGRKEAIDRFHQMQEVRSILHSQKSSHLVIPRANLCEKFLVEERLPIEIGSYRNMALYLSEPQAFDEAIRELVRLFSVVYLRDLVSFQGNPLGHIEDVNDFVRYDNLPLYIVKENGKRKGMVGLIDLEHKENRPQTEGFYVLARIFPLHVDLIKEEASKLNRKINDQSLEISAAKGKKYLQVGFIDHLNWLRHRGISTDNCFQISPQRVEELTTVIEKEWIKLNEGTNNIFKRRGYLDCYKPQANFFLENPENVAREIAESSVLLILDNLKFQLEKKRKKALAKLENDNIAEADLVGLRSPIINRKELHSGIHKLIRHNPKIKFEIPEWYDLDMIAEQLAYVVMENLAKNGDIFFFDPAYYIGDKCWVRY
jgi:hypothetical protein